MWNRWEWMCSLSCSSHPVGIGDQNTPFKFFLPIHKMVGHSISKTVATSDYLAFHQVVALVEFAATKAGLDQNASKAALPALMA